MVEPIEFTTEPLQEPFASRDAVVSCLARLSVRNDGAMRSEAARANIDLARETLPLSGLVTLAAEFGLKAERVRLDWQGLKTAVSVRSVLIVRNNSEVVVVTGGGRSGAEEVSVWDPHHDGVVFFVSREDFERTWSGHALLIASKDAGANIFDISPTPSGRSKQQRAPRKPQVSLGLSLGVAATALVTSLGMVLFLLTPPDADQAAGPGNTTRVGSVGAQNPLVTRREAAPPARAVATTPVETTSEAASISAPPISTGAAAEPKPGTSLPLGARKREARPATQSHP